MSAAGRLVLGTAQFGLRYGISNSSGQVSRAEIRNTLDFASESGVRALDTAVAYGDSEARLGEYGVSGWRVISKLPHIEADGSALPAEVERLVAGSLERLKIPRLQGLLLHRSTDLLGPRGRELHDCLLSLKRDGLIEKIGASIYDPAELADLSGFELDLVQAPFNILDRRLVDSGWLSRLASRGTEVHVRSIFLQGLLLMTTERRPPAFARWNSVWRMWDAWQAESGVAPAVACVQFALSFPQIDGVVVGVEGAKQLDEILRAGNATGVPLPPASLRTEDVDLINPSRWPTS
jgi:aryl-alcohol dehydrogenase-like predicted oxidoreductase